MKGVLRAVVATALLAWGAWAPRAFAYGITVSPANEEIRLPPGGSGTFQVQVVNPSDSTLALKAYAWDLWHSPKRPLLLAPPGTQPRSAAFWLAPTPTHLLLAPHAHNTVTVSVNVPPDAEGGHYAVLFVQSAIADLTTHTVAARTGARIAVTVLVDVAGTEHPAFHVDSVDYEPPDASNPARFRVEATNTGNIHARLHLKGVLQRPDGSRVGTIESEHHPLCLPQQQCSIEAKWTGDLPPADYDLTAVLDFGTPKPDVVQRRFTVGPTATTPAPAAPPATKATSATKTTSATKVTPATKATPAPAPTSGAAAPAAPGEPPNEPVKPAPGTPAPPPEPSKPSG